MHLYKVSVSSADVVITCVRVSLPLNLPIFFFFSRSGGRKTVIEKIKTPSTTHKNPEIEVVDFEVPQVNRRVFLVNGLIYLSSLLPGSRQCSYRVGIFSGFSRHFDST